ncbi:MAG TPA: ATP synthase subunit I [Thiobacillus sp.]
MFTGSTTGTQRVAMAQAVFAPVAALVGAGWGGINSGAAALYGVLVALLVSLVLVWRERESIKHPEWDQHRLFKQFIRTGIERLLVLVGLMFVGLGVLKLMPLPMLLGLLSAQLAWLAVITSRK